MDTNENLISALRRISAIPLCGEPIADTALRHDYIYSDEYDPKENAFNPCCDTESALLEDAVETAREHHWTARRRLDATGMRRGGEELSPCHTQRRP